MDVAASEFYKDGKYDLDFKNPKSNSADFIPSDKLGQLYLEYAKEFPVVSIEDPFDQDDWAAWSALTGATPIQIVGDDLTVRLYFLWWPAAKKGYFLASHPIVVNQPFFYRNLIMTCRLSNSYWNWVEFDEWRCLHGLALC